MITPYTREHQIHGKGLHLVACGILHNETPLAED